MNQKSPPSAIEVMYSFFPVDQRASISFPKSLCKTAFNIEKINQTLHLREKEGRFSTREGNQVNPSKE